MNFLNRFSSFLKFSRVGIFVTLFSMTISFIFLKLLGSPLYITYVLNYLFSIFLSYHLNRIYTFGSAYLLSALLQYYLAYIVSMLFGLGILFICRNIFPYENWVITYMTIPLRFIVNYFLVKKVFSENLKKEKEA